MHKHAGGAPICQTRSARTLRVVVHCGRSTSCWATSSRTPAAASAAQGDQFDQLAGMASRLTGFPIPASMLRKL